MTNKGKVPISPLQWLNEFRHGPLTVIVWIVAVAGVVVLFKRQNTQTHYIGYAMAMQAEVSPAENGLVESLLVELYDDVEAGQVVARLDDSLLRAEMRTAQIEVEKLRAEVIAAREALSSDSKQAATDWRADLERFEVDVEERRLDALALKVQLESDRVDKERYALERDRIFSLLDSGATDRSSYDELRLLHDRTQKRIEQNTALLRETERALADASDRLEQFKLRMPSEDAESATFAPLTVAVEMQEARVAELRTQLRAAALRAPVNGRVTRVLCQAGQAVRTGEPVLIVTEKHATQVLAYAREHDPLQLTESSTVLLARADGAALAESRVLKVSPAIEELPARFWPAARSPVYGRPFTVAVAPALQLIPGESVQVRLAGTSFSLP